MGNKGGKLRKKSSAAAPSQAEADTTEQVEGAELEVDRKKQVAELFRTQAPSGWKHEIHPKIRVRLQQPEDIDLSKIEHICEHEIGAVRKIEHGEKRDICFVVFQDLNAKTAIKKKKEFLENVYQINIVVEEDVRTTENESSDEEEEDETCDTEKQDENEGCIENIVTLEISNINSRKYSRKEFKDFLSPKVKNSVQVEKLNKVYLVFLQESDAKCLVNDHEHKPLSFGGTPLFIQIVDTIVLGSCPFGQCSHAVELKGDVSEKEIRQQYHGETIADIYFKSKELKSCVITYRSSEDAEAVCRGKSNVKPLLNDYRPNMFFQQQCNDKVLLHDLPGGTTREVLEAYISKHVPGKIRQIVFGSLQTALATFKGDAFAGVYRLTRMKPFLGCMIKASRIQEPSAVQIIGMSPDKRLTIQGLKRVFEDYECTFSEFKEGFIVEFNRPSDVEECLKDNIQVVDGVHVQLKVFYPCLGFIPLDRDIANPNLPSHKDIPYCVETPEVLQFLTKSDSHRQSVDHFMSEVSTVVKWPLSKDEKTIMLHCALSTGDPDFDKQFRDWEATAKSNFDIKMNEFTSVRMPIDEHLHKTFMDKWKLVLVDSNVVWSQCENDLVITGIRKAVMKTLPRARNVLSIVDDEHIKGIGFVKEESTIPLALQRVQSFSSRVTDLLKGQFKGITIKYINDQLVVTGPHQDVSEFMIFVEHLKYEYTCVTFAISRAKEELLLNQKVVMFLQNELKAFSINIGFAASNGDLVIYVQETRDILAGKSYIDSSFHESQIDCHADTSFIIGTQSWRQYKEQIVNEHDGFVAISETISERSTIQVVKFTNKVSRDIHAAVSDFLNKFGICNAKVEMELGVALVIEEFHRRQLNQLQQTLLIDESNEGSIELHTVPPGFLVTGPKNRVHSVLQQLENMSQSVSSKEFKIENPWESKYVLSNFDTVQSANRRVQVITLLGKGHKLQYTPRKRVPQHNTGKPMFKGTRKGFEVVVVEGDITTLKVDAIVNAANDKLLHGGGIAGAIVGKGGTSIQEECTHYIQIHGALKRREAFVSKAGTLPCKKIIHTVGPRYDKNRDDNNELLFEAVWYAIEAGSKHKLRSIAIPMISSGIFGFPKEQCAQQIALAVMNFIESASDSTIEKILLIDIDQTSLDKLSSVFEMVFETEEVVAPAEPHSEPSSPLAPEVTRPTLKPGRPLTASGRPKSAHRMHFETGVTGTVLEMHIGDIVQEEVDVIVNTTAENLTLDCGAVSKHILQHAGDYIQTEVTQNKPPHFTCGDIVETSGGRLKCKQIYHTALKSYSTTNKHPIDVFHRTVKSCLETAHRRGHKSIAFPALGTGNLSFPPSKVAQLFMKIHAEFSASIKDTSLQKMILSLRSQDAALIQAFSDEGLTPYAPEGSGFAPRLSIALPATVKHRWETPESLAVRVECGDIATYSVDVIVNACTKPLKLNTGGISSYILNKAGPIIQQECDQKYPNGANEGTVCKTSCGNLPCKEIYHCICTKFSRNSNEPLQHLKNVILTCLEEAHISGYKSIAMPALGTGGFGFRSDICANATEECILNFSRKYPHTKLEIIIVLRQQDSENVKAFLKGVPPPTAMPTLTTDLPEDREPYVVPELPSTSERPNEPRRESQWTKTAKGLLGTSNSEHVPIKECSFGSLTVQVVVEGSAKAMFQMVNFRIGGKLLHPASTGALIVDIVDKSKGEIKQAVMSLLQNEEARKVYVNLIDIETEICTCGVIANLIAECIHSAVEEMGFPSLQCLRFVLKSDNDAVKFFKILKMNADKITLYLFSSEKNNFSKAENWLHEAFVEKCNEIELTSKFEYILLNFSDDRIASIKALENMLPIHIEVKRSPPMLKVKGLNEDIGAVREILLEMQIANEKEFSSKVHKEAKQNEQRIKEQHEEYIWNTVKWEYEDGSWKRFDKPDNILIEQGSQQKLNMITLKRTGCYVDLTRKMYVTPAGEYRIEKRNTDLELPSTWSADFHHGKTTLVGLQPGSAEYQNIESTFKNSVSENVSIKQIKRVQNIFLWTRYINRRKHMQEMGLKEKLERNLWHGTDEKAVAFINDNGFDKSYFGANGTAYGIGVYFAQDASYSHHYAKPNSNGERHMYYTRVLTGDFTEGRSDIRVPPVKSGTMTYDSVVDSMDPNKRKMFVVFHQDQTYPEYLIIYTG